MGCGQLCPPVVQTFGRKSYVNFVYEVKPSLRSGTASDCERERVVGSRFGSGNDYIYFHFLRPGKT